MKIPVVGFDPSLRNWGAARGWIETTDLSIHIDKLEVVQTKSDNDKTIRKNCKDLTTANQLHQGIKEYVDYAGIIFCETPVGSKSARAMASYGVCIGVLGSIEKDVISISPKDIKKRVSGTQSASKEEVIKAAMELHPEAPWFYRKLKGEMVPIDSQNEHVADAVMAIHVGVNTPEFKQLLNMLVKLQSAA